MRSVPESNVLGIFSFLSCSVDKSRTHQSTSSSDNDALRVMCRSRVDADEDAARFVSFSLQNRTLLTRAKLTDAMDISAVRVL